MNSERLDKRQPEDDLLIQRSRISVAGKPIDPHRSLAHLAFPKHRLWQVVFIPMAFNCMVWLLFDNLTRAWSHFLLFWATKIGLPVMLGHTLLGFEAFRLSLTTFTLPANPPDAFRWWLIAALTLIGWIATRYIPQQLLPLRYLVRLAALIQASALMFFALFPGKFPYQIGNHLHGLQIAGIGMLLIIPWLHGLVYYIFDFSIGQKLALTGLTLLYLMLALPCLIMIHSYLLANYSLLIMPLLNFLGGIMLMVMGCIGLYGWAMSWEQNRKGQ